MPGMHVWQGSSIDPKISTWSFNKYIDAVEYLILKRTPEAGAEYDFILEDVKTGENYEMNLDTKNRLN